jgi:hypothetical protein
MLLRITLCGIMFADVTDIVVGFGRVKDFLRIADKSFK